MPYHLKSKPDTSNRNKIIFAVVLFVVLSLASFFFPNALKSIDFAITRPLWNIRLSVADSFQKFKDFFVFRNTLITKNESLQSELDSLKLKEADYDVLTTQNQELKSLLGRSESLPQHIISRILSKPPYSPYDTLVIDVGSDVGVVLEDKVYLSDSIIIGTIKGVTAHNSQVELFSSSNIKQEAVLSRTGESFTLLGQGGANFKVEVPKDTDILWGDNFVYPSINPKVLGSVYYIDTNSQSSFKTIYLRIPGNVFSSKYVFVETQAK